MKTKGFIIKRKFQVISLSGGSCSLNCFYCQSKYIQSMESLTREEGLYKAIIKAYERGVRGFLISGGFDREGRLINVEMALKVLKKVRKELKDEVVFNIHPGLLDRATIEEMADVIDMVDYEFAYSPKAFESKGVKRNREDYLRVLDDLISYGPKYVVPHIMLGLPEDEVEEAIRVASNFKPYLLNFLVLIPPVGGQLPSLKEVLDKIRIGSRLMNKRVSLGCMRPYKLKEKLDEVVIREGLIERIANPYHKLVNKMEMYDACCSLPEKYLERFKLREEGN